MYQLAHDQLEEALRRARHSRDVFLKAYNTPVSAPQIRDFAKLLATSPEPCQIELILLG